MLRTMVLLFLLITAAPGLVCSAASRGIVPAVSQDPRATADGLMNSLFQSYQSFTRIMFEDLVSNDFRPDKMTFISQVSSQAASEKVIEMHYVLNEVLPARKKLAVSFSWDKKVQPASSGDLLLSSGEARAVFIKEKSGWKLFSLTGNKPF